MFEIDEVETGVALKVEVTSAPITTSCQAQGSAGRKSHRQIMFAKVQNAKSIFNREIKSTAVHIFRSSLQLHTWSSCCWSGVRSRYQVSLFNVGSRWPLATTRAPTITIQWL